MKKVLCAVLTASIVLSLLSGCGKKPEASSASDNSSEPDTAAVAAPASGLTIYSPLPQRLAQAAADGFSAQTGVQVNLVCDSASALIDRISSESAAVQADVLFGCGAEIAQQMSSMFTPYKTAALSGIDTRFLHDDALWTPLTPMPVVLFYNKHQTSKAPTGWNTLTLNSYKGWIAFADPAASGTSYTAICAMLKGAEKDAKSELKGDAFVQKLAENLDGKMLASIPDVYKAIAEGQFAAGVTLESSALKYIDAGYQDIVGISYPEEGTAAALEVSSVVKGAPHEDYAQQFIDYVSGAEFQKLLVSDFGMRTVRTDVTDAEGLTPMKDIVLVDYDYASAVSNRDALLKTFAEAEAKARTAAASSQAK